MSAYAGTSFVTTAPAATSAQAPTVRGATPDRSGPDGRAVANLTKGSKSVARLSPPSGATARGYWSFVGPGRRTDEDAVAESRRLVDQSVVLQFAVVTHAHRLADVGATAHDAVLAELRVLADLGQLPYGRAVPEVGRVGDLGGFLHDGAHEHTVLAFGHGFRDGLGPFPAERRSHASRVPVYPRCVNRHGFLAALHKRLKPRTYLEIGVHRGQSLTLSRVPSVGIDPEFNVDFELQADVHLVRATSDEFFARKDPLAHLPIKVVDLAFIDGMHLAEYSLRDYLAVERFTDGGSVIVFDDMLPRNILEANRYRKSSSWTGDVYKALEALRALRPDLIVIEVATEGSGTAVVLCPDASRDGRLEGYDDWLESSAIVPDPQPVPEEVLKRTRAVDPEEFLSLPGWDAVVAARGERGPSAEVRRAFAAFATA